MVASANDNKEGSRIAFMQFETGWAGKLFKMIRLRCFGVVGN
jgi:hypothetical protein